MGWNTYSPKKTQSSLYHQVHGKLQPDNMAHPFHSRVNLADQMPPWACSHRFWCHKSATENLVFSAWADPCKDREHILDVNFLRHHVGYLADCERAVLDPSPFQLILFVHNASSLLCPPFLNWMPIWMLTWVHIGLAWIAETVLG